MNIHDRAIRISENADFIRKNEWDDPEVWVVEAAELVHDIIDLIEYFQSGGEIPIAWQPPELDSR